MIEVNPFLGRMVIEVVKEDTKERLDKKLAAETGVSQDFLSKFEVVRGEDTIDPHTGQKKFEALKAKTPINRGKIIKMSPDCFGQNFKNQYGNDREYPGVGDIIMFVPNKSYQVDAENNYHIVDDNDIVGWIKAGESINE